MAKPLTVQDIAAQRLARPVAPTPAPDDFTEAELAAMDSGGAVDLPDDAGPLPGDAPASLPWWRYGDLGDIDKLGRQIRNVGKGVAGMAWDGAKQAVLHPLDTLQGAAEGLEASMPQSLAGGESGEGLDPNTMPRATLEMIMGQGLLPAVASPLQGAAVGMGRRMGRGDNPARVKAAVDDTMTRANARLAKGHGMPNQGPGPKSATFERGKTLAEGEPVQSFAERKAGRETGQQSTAEQDRSGWLDNKANRRNLRLDVRSADAEDAAWAAQNPRQAAYELNANRATQRALEEIRQGRWSDNPLDGDGSNPEFLRSIQEDRARRRSPRDAAEAELRAWAESEGVSVSDDWVRRQLGLTGAPTHEGWQRPGSDDPFSMSVEPSPPAFTPSQGTPSQVRALSDRLAREAAQARATPTPGEGVFARLHRESVARRAESARRHEADMARYHQHDELGDLTPPVSAAPSRAMPPQGFRGEADPFGMSVQESRPAPMQSTWDVDEMLGGVGSDREPTSFSSRGWPRYDTTAASRDEWAALDAAARARRLAKTPLLEID